MSRARATVPAHASSGRTTLALLVLVALVLVFVAGIVLAPRLERDGVAAGSWLRLGYAGLCHQMAERSIRLDGRALAVCARCTGLYLGGAVGVIVGASWLVPPKRRPRPLWLALAAAPTGVDALLPGVGLPGLANMPRLLVSVPAGLVLGLFLAVGVAAIFDAARSDGASRPCSPATPCSVEDVDG